MEGEYENNGCPEPDMFPQIPADFDGNHYGCEDDANRQSHVCITQENKEQKHRYQNGSNFDAYESVGAFSLGVSWWNMF